MKEYKLIANLVIETTEDKIKLIEQEIMDKIIEIVEKHDSIEHFTIKKSSNIKE